MRIVMVLRDPAVLAGEERSAVLETGALRALGHQVHLLHGAPAIPEGLVDGEFFAPELLDLNPLVERRAVRQAVRRLTAYVAQHKIDVIHLHGTLRFAVARRLAARMAMVSTAHVVNCPNRTRYLWNDRRACERKIGLGCLSTGYRKLGCGHLGNGEPVGLPGFVRGMVMDQRARAQLAGSHRVIAPSRWMADYLAANGTPADRIRVLEPPLATRGAIAARPEGRPLLTYAGRLVDFKGADQLIRASTLLEFDHRIAIVGMGPTMPALRRLAADCGIAHRVHFHGALAPAELDGIRRGSAAVVVPSLWPETYAMVGAEALALGVPVVGFGIGGSAEWLALGGPLARTVPPLDVAGLARALTDVVADPPSDAERRATATAVRRSLASMRHGERLAAVYGEAIAAGSTATMAGRPGEPGQRPAPHPQPEVSEVGCSAR